MPSLGRRIKEATNHEALEQCLKEFLELQRVAAEETNAQVFFVQLQEIKCLQALISRRLREVMAAELERAGYEVNLVDTQ
jgi:hypothetical protein